MSDVPVQLNPTGVRIALDAETAAVQFHQQHMLSLPGFLDDKYLALLTRIEPACTWVREMIENLGQREVEEPRRMSGAILIGLRNPQLLEWMRQVTGNRDIAIAGGNIARSWPGCTDRLDWHDDNEDLKRVAALTIMLSETDFEGGVFELRPKQTTDVTSFRHARRGDALLIEVNPRLEHRVLPLSAGGPRCVFAGWFLTGAED